MTRVVIKRTEESLQDACDSCPVNAFKKNGNEFVINPELCIDCGVCETIVEDDVIVESSEADESDIMYNEEHSK